MGKREIARSRCLDECKKTPVTPRASGRGAVIREQLEQRKDFVRCEITSGNFSRSLPMPAGIDTGSISATLHDGILEITLPKHPRLQRRAIKMK